MSSEDERRKQVEQRLWDEWWVNRFRRSKWKIPIIVTIIAIIVVASSLFVVLPGTYGNNFVSVKWDIGAYLGYSAQPPYNMYVMLPSGIGTSGNCNYVAPRNCYISNSYFMAVRVHSNEFEMVFLVYDSPVNDPADIESNRDHLVWGGYQTPNTLGVFTFEEPDGYPSRYAGKYDYYVMRWKLNNYTYLVPYGHMKWSTGSIVARIIM